MTTFKIAKKINRCQGEINGEKDPGKHQSFYEKSSVWERANAARNFGDRIFGRKSWGEGAIARSRWGSLAVKLKAMSIQTSVLTELLQD
jgi:hypothetical protein